jgi:hypothetical protein
MDPVILIVGGLVAFLLVSWAILPARPGGAQGLDYEAMAEIEEHDIDQMVAGLDELRRRTGRRSVGEELADEWRRTGWD